MADSYLTFAADYDWLFDDDVLTDGGAINYPAAARLFQRASAGQAVLDASCGTGINAAVLARRGFDVWGTDGSEAMISKRPPGSAASSWRSRCGAACGRIFPAPSPNASTS